MINPPQLKEIDFTFKCKIATYDERALIDVQKFINDRMNQNIKDLVCRHGVVSGAETIMDGVI
jgi:hypothetical protein